MLHDPPNLIERLKTAHKGDCGRVLLIAGSRQFSGAAVLSAAGACRGGAGFVEVALPKSLLAGPNSFDPGVILHGLRENSARQLAFPAWLRLEKLVSGADCIVIGPGCGQSEDLQALLYRVAKTAHCPLVIDADALNILAQDPNRPSLPKTSILTPHPGEAGRLLGWQTNEIQVDRPRALAELIELLGTVVVLKGAQTLVGAGRLVFQNGTGSAAMAVAGMGDVLAGLIGALVAQGESPFDAACQAVWAHGFAGDLASASGGIRGLAPSQVAQYIPQALRELSP